MSPDKGEILRLIIEQLSDDLAVLEQAVALARDTATHADCLGSSKYETMGLEASYLAQGQGARLLEIERALEQFRRVSPECNSSDAIALSSLVELIDEEGGSRWLWLAREAGGLKVNLNACEVTVVTPQSPLGRVLIGRMPGDEVEVVLSGVRHCFEVVSFC